MGKIGADHPGHGQLQITESVQVSMYASVSYHSPLRMMQEMELPPGASFDPDPANAGRNPNHG